MSTASKVKLFIVLMFLLLLIIVAFQNLAEIEIQMLFWKGTLPQAVVLAVAVGVGFLMGLSTGALSKVRRRARDRTAKDQQTAT